MHLERIVEQRAKQIDSGTTHKQIEFEDIQIAVSVQNKIDGILNEEVIKIE